MRGVNLAIKDGLYQASQGVKLHFDDYVQYVPVALYLTLDFMGLKAKHSFGERLAVGVVTYISVTALSQSIKYIVREPRPDTGTRNSFPSGHTMTAFAGAELVRSEYGWGAGMGAYALAATVGFMRMYNGRHWFNDVLAGAGFGILSARIGYWMLPLSREIFKIPRKGQAFIATPTYHAHTKSFGMSCAIQF
jgi:membrane-associated phospholipid phosphatase